MAYNPMYNGVRWPTDPTWCDRQWYAEHMALGLWVFNPLWRGDTTPNLLSSARMAETMTGTSTGLSHLGRVFGAGACTGMSAVSGAGCFKFGSADSWTVESHVLLVQSAAYADIARMDSDNPAPTRDIWVFRKTNTNTLQLQFGDVAGTLHTSTYGTALATDFYHLAATVTPATVCLFVNGKKVVSAANGSSAWLTTAPLFGLAIGAHRSDGDVVGETWNGNLLTLGIYKRALPASAISALAADPFGHMRKPSRHYFFAPPSGHVPYNLILSRRRRAS